MGARAGGIAEPRTGRVWIPRSARRRSVVVDLGPGARRAQRCDRSLPLTARAFAGLAVSVARLARFALEPARRFAAAVAGAHVRHPISSFRSDVRERGTAHRRLWIQRSARPLGAGRARGRPRHMARSARCLPFRLCAQTGQCLDSVTQPQRIYSDAGLVNPRYVP